MRSDKTFDFEEMLTVEEVAEILKIRRGWIYQRIHANNLPFPMVKIGHYPRFPVSGVQKYIEQQMRPAGSVA